MHEVIAAVGSADPRQCYEALGRMPCLVWQEGMWVAAHPEVARAVLAHPACRVRPVGEPVPAALAGGCAGEVFGALVRMNDGPGHVAGKPVLQRALASAPLDVVGATAARIARIGWQERGRGAGAVTRWMHEVPVRTVASLLGFGEARLPEVASLVGQFVACLSPLSSAAQIDAAHAASEVLLMELGAMLRAVDGLRTESIMAAVLHGAECAAWRDERAILANLLGLLSQTYEATAGLIGNAIVALQKADVACEGRAGALALVREVGLRDPAVQNTRRYVAEDAHIGGVDVKKGDVILLVLAAAGAPFGHGAHKCPGQQIAETIAAAAIAELAVPIKELGPLQWRYRKSVNARIPEFMETT